MNRVAGKAAQRGTSPSCGSNVRYQRILRARDQSFHALIEESLECH